MESAVDEERAAKWAKLEEDYRRGDLQELDIPEHIKLELREELEQMYEEARMQMAAGRNKSLVIVLSAGAALLVSGFLAGGTSPGTCSWFQVRCWETAAAALLYAVSRLVRDRRRGFGLPKFPVRKAPVLKTPQF